MAIYYVSSAGNDGTGTGAIGAPWLTIGHAITASSAGDTINLNGGNTFTENVTLSSGRTIQSYGAGQATVAGGASPPITINDCDGVTISNLIITQNATTSTSTNYYIGAIYFHEVSGTRFTAGVTVTGCTITGGQSGIGFVCAAGSAGGWNSVTLSNNTISGCTEGGISLIEAALGNVNKHYSNVNITGNTVSGITGDANTLTNTGAGIFIGWMDSTTGTGAAQCFVQSNLVSACGAGCTASNGGGPGGIVIVYTDGLVMQSNVVHDVHTFTHVDGVGCDLDLGCSNCTMQYNYTYHNDGSGFFLYGTGNGNVVRWNISVGDVVDVSGNDFASILVASGCGSTVIHNNTVIGFTAGAPALTISVANAVGQRVYNNIFSGGAGAPAVSLPAALDGTFGLEGNSYQTRNGSFWCKLAGADYLTLAAWRTATGRETAHGFAGTMQFADPHATVPIPSQLGTFKDYQLSSASPLVGAGLDLNSLYSVNPGTRDFNGTTISVPYSVGAISPSVAVSAWAAAVQADIPHAWFRLGEASGAAINTAITYSGGTYTNVTLGQPSLVASNVNAAGSFNGASSKMDTGILTALPCSAMTIECWFKPSSVTGNHALIDQWDGSGTLAYLVETNGTEVNFQLHDSGFFGITTTGAGLTAGQVYHLVCTWSGSNTGAIYLNGVAQTVGTSNNPGTPSVSEVTIGRRTPTDIPNTNWYSGVIDEVSIYPSALSQARVTAHYNAGLAALAKIIMVPQAVKRASFF